MTPVLVALVAGLLVGGIVGIWIGLAGRVGRSVFEEWSSSGGQR